jgi:hypothetical protein
MSSCESPRVCELEAQIGAAADASPLPHAVDLDALDALLLDLLDCVRSRTPGT